MRTIPMVAFVIALAAFVSGATPVFASGELHPCLEDWTSSECIDISNVRDPDQFESDKEVVDSGNTSREATKQSTGESEKVQ